MGATPGWGRASAWVGRGENQGRTCSWGRASAFASPRTRRRHILWRKHIIWRKNRTPSAGHPCARTRMSEPRDSWKCREFCREAEIRGVELALKLLRADDRRYEEAPPWESLAQRALVRARALSLVRLCDDMLGDNISEKQTVAILKSFSPAFKWQAAAIRRAIGLRGSECGGASSSGIDAREQRGPAPRRS